MMERDLNDTGRGDNATFRELKAAEEALVKRMSAIEMEQAAQRAALMHLPDDVRQLTQAVNGMASKMPQAAPQSDAALTGAVLALNRMLDDQRKQPPPTTTAELLKLLNTQPPGSGKTWGLVGALSMIALFLAYQAFVG